MIDPRLKLSALEGLAFFAAVLYLRDHEARHSFAGMSIERHFSFVEMLFPLVRKQCAAFEWKHFGYDEV